MNWESGNFSDLLVTGFRMDFIKDLLKLVVVASANKGLDGDYIPVDSGLPVTILDGVLGLYFP